MSICTCNLPTKDACEYCQTAQERFLNPEGYDSSFEALEPVLGDSLKEKVCTCERIDSINIGFVPSDECFGCDEEGDE